MKLLALAVVAFVIWAAYSCLPLILNFAGGR